jgi:retrograde regulation protein 2
MKLPPQLRELHPVPLLPAGRTDYALEVVNAASGLIVSAVPTQAPPIAIELIHYVSRNIWQDTGESEDTNSARAIHAPTSGVLAGLPGINHEDRAIIALVLCARWGSDLGPADLRVRDNLRSLVGAELGWWCDYIGAVCRLLGTIRPTLPAKATDLVNTVQFKASTSHGLGKKGHKVGIRLDIRVAKCAKMGLSAGKLEDLFSKVGKGTHQGWKIEAEVGNL